LKRALPPLLALFVGAITLAFTIGLCVHERASEEAQLRAVFDANARQTAGRIEQRIANYEQMLRGVQGLFTSSDGVAPESFEAYVGTVMAGPDAAGLQSVAFGRLVTLDEMPRHLERMRRSGHPGYAVRPPGSREFYSPLELVAPDSLANRQILGFDSLTDPARRLAMLQARDSGNAALTGLVQLRVDSGATLRAGCLLYLPVYARGAPTATIAERRANGVGWVRAAFRVSDLMSTLYGEQSAGLVVRLHDGADSSDATLIYRSDGPASAPRGKLVPRFQAQEFITLAGHTWTLQLYSLPEFERQNERNASNVILVAGVVLSLLLALITHQLVTGRARAYAAAQAMTRELRASEERYRRIVETAGEGIWLLDAERRISFINPRITQWLGRSEAEMLGRAIDDFMDPDQAQRCRAALMAPPLGDGASVELMLRRLDGSGLWVSLSTRPLFDDAGRPSGALGMLTDIDERRLAEERRRALEAQLRESQKMEAIGTLAGGIAHDFNNILAAIIGNVAAARQDAAIGLSPDASLAQIERAAVRARSLVQQILTFSRMQAQELHVLALQPVIEETLEMLRAAMPAQVELVVELPAEPVCIRGDTTQIQQIVMNLCTNAWHALPAGRGRIEVGLAVERAERALVGPSAAPHAAPGAPEQVAWPRVHLWITDNGSGMDEATRARVFEPFFTTKQVGHGTGLGLAVVHGIVSVHGGAIHVDSAPGLGSRFGLWFPLQDVPQAVAAAAPAEPAAARGGGQRVLCVDDDPAMVLMVERLLQRSGYEVKVFEQPLSALHWVTGHPDGFDIVVTDFNMPEMNGMELAQALARVAPGLPVIITSGFISDEMRQQAVALGIGALLQKEYTLERLAGLVDSVLAQRRARTA
jgi:PAS domain S-box-containing protein